MFSFAQTENMDIMPLKVASISLSNTPAPSCFSPCLGSATITVSGGVSPYSYTLTNGSFIVSASTATNNVFKVDSLCLGAYTIQVCDGALSCSSSTFAINLLSMPAFVSHTATPGVPPSPSYLYNVKATISGGTPPYYTKWYDFMGNLLKTHTVTTNIDTGYVYPGGYTLTVIDSANTMCTATGSGGSGTVTPTTYTFMICDNGFGMSSVNIIGASMSSNSVCIGSQYTVTVSNFLYGPSPYINCSNNTFGTYTTVCPAFQSLGCYGSIICTANYTDNGAIFASALFYYMGCPPITSSAPLYVLDCNFTDVNSFYALNADFTINPNPSFGEIQIHSSVFNEVHLRITDILGKIVFEKSVKTNEMIDTGLSSGLYYVEINGYGQGTKMKWIVANR